jgi:hypothetical protein
MAGTNGTNTAWVIAIESNYSFTFSIPFGGTTNIATASGALTRNTWTHVAVVYSGGTARIYFNGVSVAGPVAITLPVSSTVSFKIGYDNVGTVSTRFNGYISNVAINTTTALYTSAFTPPTIPLTAVSGTSLLTCQSNRFIDNSTNALAITVAGNPSIQRFSPFLPTASYAPSVDGGSGYFDGSGDYLSLAGNTAFTMPGDFTAEAWVYCNGYTNDYAAIFGFSSDSESTGWNILVRTNGRLHFNVAMTFTDATGTLPLNQWTHVALVRSGSGSGNVKLYVNGVADATTLTVTATATSPSTVMLGSYPGITSRAFNGYIMDARIVKGTAVYTANFTPPTAPLTAITNTSLLTNFTNAGIIDNAEMNNLETVGNAQISTAQSKFGGGSMLFDGTGDYLVPNGAGTNLGFVFGTGDFTIEFWVYFISGLGSDIVLYDSRPLSTNGVYPTLYVNSSSQLSYVVSGADRITSGSAFSATQWYHIALCRSGTSTRMFINGVQVGSTYSDSNNYLNPARRPVIAINGFNETAAPLNGYIDDLRITKAARYTTSFTPQRSQWQDQ